MLSIETHGDVVRIHMSSFWGRRTGYTVSAYLVRNVLIDTGFSRAGRDLSRFLDATPTRGVMVTHWHEDHGGNTAMIAARGLPMAIASGTIAELHAPDPIAAYRRLVWGTSPSLARVPDAFTDETLRFAHLPGHSADHHVVFDETTRTLFGGDLYLGVKVRLAHTHEDPRELVRSLRTAISWKPARLFCAHRGLVPDAIGQLSAKATWLEEIIAETDRLTDAGWSESAIRKRLLGSEEATRFFSFGEYARLNLVRAIQLSRPGRAPTPNAG